MWCEGFAPAPPAGALRPCTPPASRAPARLAEHTLAGGPTFAAIARWARRPCAIRRTTRGSAARQPRGARLGGAPPTADAQRRRAFPDRPGAGLCPIRPTVPAFSLTLSPPLAALAIIGGMEHNRFSQFEERIQALIEGGFARLFAGRLQPREVALRLARAMEDNADLNDLGVLCAPNRYVVRLNPADHAALLAAQPDVAAALSRHLVTLAVESDLHLDAAPEVVLLPDPAIAPRGVGVQAAYTENTRQTTQMMPVQHTAHTPSPPKLPQAYLVLDGSRYVPLTRSVITVGRRRDNFIVLDDARVSRQHCQLRYRMGQFVLYDLGSKGGTFVNGERVTECALRSGDVLSLAGVQMVYVQDDSTNTPRATDGDTRMDMPPVGDVP